MDPPSPAALLPLGATRRSLFLVPRLFFKTCIARFHLEKRKNYNKTTLEEIESATEKNKGTKINKAT
jgi:hypothetical protein